MNIISKSVKDLKSVSWFIRNGILNFCHRSAAKLFHQFIEIPKFIFQYFFFILSKRPSHHPKLTAEEFAYLKVSYFQRNWNGAVKKGKNFTDTFYWVNNLSDRIFYFPDKFEAFSPYPIWFYIYERRGAGRNISISKRAHRRSAISKIFQYNYFKILKYKFFRDF